MHVDASYVFDILLSMTCVTDISNSTGNSHSVHTQK